MQQLDKIHFPFYSVFLFLFPLYPFVSLSFFLSLIISVLLQGIWTHAGKSTKNRNKTLLCKEIYLLWVSCWLFVFFFRLLRSFSSLVIKLIYYIHIGFPKLSVYTETLCLEEKKNSYIFCWREQCVELQPFTLKTLVFKKYGFLVFPWKPKPECFHTGVIGRCELTKLFSRFCCKIRICFRSCIENNKHLNNEV